MINSPEKNLELILRSGHPSVEIKLRGKYKVLVSRAGSVIRETDWFDNRILNQGLDYLGSMSLLSPSTYPNGPMGYAHVGTGTSVVQDTDTTLSSFLTSAIYAAGNYYGAGSAPTYEATVYQYYTFTSGAINTSITEVGVSRTSATGSLFSRSLISDSNGVPISIPVTAQDQLTIVYALTFVPTLTAVNGTVTLDGVAYNWQAYITNITNLANGGGNLRMPVPNSNYPFMGLAVPASTNIGSIQGPGTPLSPTVITDSNVPGATSSATLTASGSNTSYAYTAGTYTAKSTLLALPATANLAGGFQSLFLRFCLTDPQIGFNVLYYFSAPVAKTNTKVMSLVFSSTWSR